MKILIAQDEAFNFTYQANIDSLAHMGEVRFFSPLRDSLLPACDLLYLPGGYPELVADRLAANASMRTSIQAYAEGGGHVFAECGGFMYLCHHIDGREMCGVLPVEATMEGARLHLGYRQMEWNGIPVRGHEFHYSSIRATVLPPAVRQVVCQRNATGHAVDTPIYIYKNVIAGYTHWYWAGIGFEKIWNK